MPMPWVPRGLRHGILTTRYPRRPDVEVAHVTVAVADGSAAPGTSAGAGISASAGGSERGDVAAAAAQCPTDAITLADSGPRVDRGRCILCGRCTRLAPGTFRFDPGFEVSAVHRRALVVPPLGEDDQVVAAARQELASRVRALRRSVHVRHVDAGSDGAAEWEVAALTNPVYDVGRLGIFFTASPKHADLLLVTGAGSAGMRGPLRHTYDLMPEPKAVVAAGVDAVSGGMVGDTYATSGGVAGLVPVDVLVPGSPPTPFALLHGILLAMGYLR